MCNKKVEIDVCDIVVDLVVIPCLSTIFLISLMELYASFRRFCRPY